MIKHVNKNETFLKGNELINHITYQKQYNKGTIKQVVCRGKNIMFSVVEGQLQDFYIFFCIFQVCLSFLTFIYKFCTSRNCCSLMMM